MGVWCGVVWCGVVLRGVVRCGVVRGLRACAFCVLRAWGGNSISGADRRRSGECNDDMFVLGAKITAYSAWNTGARTATAWASRSLPYVGKPARSPRSARLVLSRTAAPSACSAIASSSAPVAGSRFLRVRRESMLGIHPLC